MSITLPRMANSLNSFSIALSSSPQELPSITKPP
jgi:hypothetical protein